MLIFQAKNTGAAKRSDDTQRHSPKLVTYKKVKSQIHTSICKHSLKAIPLNILWIGRIYFRLQILIWIVVDNIITVCFSFLRKCIGIVGLPAYIEENHVVVDFAEE